MGATTTKPATRKPATKSVNVTEILDKGVKNLNGQKLFNDSGKPEFVPFAPVILPVGDHTGTFTGEILCKLNKNKEVMYFAFFSVDGYGKVIHSMKLEEVNNLVNGAKYTLTCGEPRGEYTRIKKVEKA